MVKRMLDSLESSTNEAPPINQLAPIVKADHKLGGSYKPLRERPASG